jgi:hypothetical protein
MEEVSVGEPFPPTADGAQTASDTHAAPGGAGDWAAGPTDDGQGTGLRGPIGRLAAAQPLRLALVALALGVAVAALLPSTAFENERLGEGAEVARERLSARGRDLWQRTKTAVQRGSEAAAAAALEEFRRED